MMREVGSDWPVGSGGAMKMSLRTGLLVAVCSIWILTAGAVSAPACEACRHADAAAGGAPVHGESDAAEHDCPHHKAAVGHENCPHAGRDRAPAAAASEHAGCPCQAAKDAGDLPAE